MHRGFDLPSRSLISQADQSMVEAGDVPRSRFQNRWSHKKTGDAGVLYPFLVLEVLPGDHIKLKVQPFVRTATPVFPVMDSMRIDTHFFFCPNRLVYTSWVVMFGQVANPGDSTAFNVPQVTSTGNGFAVGSLGDHFGLPTVGQAAAILSVNALPFRAYNLIYNQWFRDENLINSAFTATSDLVQVEGSYPLRRRAKSHDYFTSALTAPQKGTAVNIQMPVTGIGSSGLLGVAGAAVAYETDDTPSGSTNYPNHAFTSAAGAFTVRMDAAGLYPQIYSESSVSAFRTAFLVQQYLEKDARGGTRYTERNFMHFRVRSPDMRLQRTEFCGGGSTPLVFTPIAQTVPGGAGVLGTLGAAGTAVGQHTADYASTEDGFIIGLVSVKSELSYSQGIHRMWSRLTKNDYYVPSFAQLGEQAVLRKEIYATGVAANDDVVFGYQERWQELRTRVSEVTGLFRPTAAGNIDEWHLSQQFTAAPVLGQTFIEDTPPMSRVLSAGVGANGQQFLFDILCEMDAVRPLPVYGTPAILGRF